MKIRPESIIEAFQKTVEFSCGARPIDFYVELGFSEKDIRESFGNGNVPVSYENLNYLVGLTKDGSNEYVTIIPREFMKFPVLQIKKLGKGLAKQGRL